MGVHHHCEHHDMHDRLGFRDWSHFRYRHELYVVYDVPFCVVQLTDYPLVRFLLCDTELSRKIYTGVTHGRVGHVYCASSECA